VQLIGDGSSSHGSVFVKDIVVRKRKEEEDCSCKTQEEESQTYTRTHTHTHTHTQIGRQIDILGRSSHGSVVVKNIVVRKRTEKEDSSCKTGVRQTN
jgi:hypothetical protein